MDELLYMGVNGSVLIIAVICFRHFFSQQVSRRLIVFLWICVIVRLLLPVSGRAAGTVGASGGGLEAGHPEKTRPDCGRLVHVCVVPVLPLRVVFRKRHHGSHRKQEQHQRWQEQKQRSRKREQQQCSRKQEHKQLCRRQKWLQLLQKHQRWRC